MRFTAAGDVIIQKSAGAPQKEIRDFVARGEARFFNLETTLNRAGECFASQFSGGSWLRADPSLLRDCMEYGFNVTTFNNNHSFDYSYGGFEITLRELEKAGIPNCGAGRSLAEAARRARVGGAAFISVNTTFKDCAIAGEGTDVFPPRPGINPLRHERILRVTPAQMAALRDVARSTGVNALAEIELGEGYGTPTADGRLGIDGLEFEVSDVPGITTRCDKMDLERIGQEIDRCLEEGLETVISVHSHQISGDSKENTADFLVEFARFCIDRGASAVVGHGPHLLRAIEIYKNRPIFYSLGDFIMQLDSIPYAPADFYETQGMDWRTNDAAALLDKRSKGGKIGLMYQKKAFETVVPYWETEGGELKRLELLPVELGFGDHTARRGLPRVCGGEDFMDRLAALSKPYSTKIIQKGSVYEIEL